MRYAALPTFVVLVALFAAVWWYAGRPAPKQQANGYTTGMELTNSAFTEGGAIPARYTCDGDKTKNLYSMHLKQRSGSRRAPQNPRCFPQYRAVSWRKHS